MSETREGKNRGPGVPEAVPRGLQVIVQRLGAETVDRVWIFPPLVQGRRERGLLAVSRFDGDEPESESRILLTLAYAAERTGRGLSLDQTLDEQGRAPEDRLPRVMEGVVRRTERDLGEPRQVVVGGDPAAFHSLLDEYEPELLDPGLPPLAAAGEEVGA